MFSKDKAAQPARPTKAGAPGLSFIGPEVVISGDIATGAQLHVEGRIDGNVQCARLCQGASGSVAGNIVADDARIAGLVEGTVFAKTLTLEGSARIKGDITYQTISMAAGAQVDGRLARRESLATAADSPPMLIATVGEASKGLAPAKVEPDALFPLAPAKQAAAG